MTKPLLKTPITRDRRTVGDWVSAAEQSTDDGRNDFAERQRRRMKEAAIAATEQTRKIVKIKKATD